MAFEEARAIFIRGNQACEAALARCPLDGCVTDHVHLRQQQSRLYKHLIPFERDEKRQLAMLQRRIDRLEPLQADISQAAYLTFHKEVTGDMIADLFAPPNRCVRLRPEQVADVAFSCCCNDDTPPSRSVSSSLKSTSPLWISASKSCKSSSHDQSPRSCSALTNVFDWRWQICCTFSACITTSCSHTRAGTRGQLLCKTSSARSNRMQPLAATRMCRQEMLSPG